MKLKIKGPIVSNSDKWIYDYFDIESTCPNDVSSVVESADGEDLDVEINSGGGSVFAGSEIYTALKSYEGNVTTKIVGIAASAASVIAMAGKKVLMSPTAQMMIHNVSSYADGDHRAMEHAAEVLKTANKTIANAYQIKTGRSQEELLDLMNKESWFTAQKAKELGFVDEVMFDSGQLVASFSGMLPPEVIEKMRNSKPQKNEAAFLVSKTRLLKLKGEEK